MLLAAILLFTPTLAASCPQQDVFESAKAGFRMDKPEASWVWQDGLGEDGNGSVTCGPQGNGGARLVTIVVSNAPVQMDHRQVFLTAHRDDILLQVEGLAQIRGAKRLVRELAGMEAPGLEVENDAAGVTYLARQFFVAAQGKLYTLQCHAPLEEFPGWEEAFLRAIDSFHTVPLDAEALQRTRLQQLASRCGSEVSLESDWKQAAARARAESKPILVTVQAISGFEVGDQVARGPFMDQDVLRLLAHRFVVLRWRRGMSAPFERDEIFGMGPHTFGDGMLVTDAEGNVQQQLFLLNAGAVYDVLVATLEAHPEWAPPVPPITRSAAGAAELGDAESAADLAAARFLLESGQREAFREQLSHRNSKTDDARWEELRARAATLRRQGKEARAAVATGLAKEEDAAQRRPTVRARLQLLDAQLQTAMGQAAESEAAFDRLLLPGRELPPDVRAQALLAKGALRLQAEDRAGAEEAWAILLQDHEGSRWSWLVAAALTAPTWGIEIYPDLRWPRPEDSALAEVPLAIAASSREEDIGTMLAGAAAYLLSQQLADGSWPAPSSYGDREPLADDFEIAATAIAGQALLRFPDQEKASLAATRALAWLLDQRARRNAAEVPPVVFMDYAVWSRSYAIFFLATCREQGIGMRDQIEAEIAACTQDLLLRQQDNGGWSYYLSGEVGGDALPQSISFTTATVVLALERVDGLGLLPAQDQKRLGKGLRCLEKMRGADQVYSYFLNGRDVEQGMRSSFEVEGSAARGPACGLALLRGGRSESASLVPLFRHYVDHLAGFGVQRRKALMHAGPFAQGSHYLLYDYATAAEALREVAANDAIPPSLKGEVRKALLRELRACRNRDGSFVDNPLIGNTSGTGLAMLALLDLTTLPQ